MVVSAPLINPEKLTMVILVPLNLPPLLGRHDNIINSAGVKIIPKCRSNETQLKNPFGQRYSDYTWSKNIIEEEKKQIIEW